MASCFGGYTQDRFQVSVDKNFFCPICTEVLKDPVQCHNQHYFCKACITKHLENSQTCPVCVQKLTEKALAKPPRIVTDYLDGLIINCGHSERGCPETMELGTLKTHEAICLYRPVACSSEQCSVTVNMKDLEEHETKHCEYRMIHCHECDEKMSCKKYDKHACLLRKEVDQMKVLLFDIRNQVTKNQETVEQKLEEVLAGVQQLSSGSSFACKASAGVSLNCKQENNVVVLGGMDSDKLSLDSVEMYSSISQSWTHLAPMNECRASATAHCYNGQIMVTGGHDNWERTDTVETSFLGVTPKEWYPCPFELPAMCSGHKTVVHHDCLWTVGGSYASTASSSKAIHKILLRPPYTTILEAEMPQPLSYHGLEIIGDDIVIIGGSTTGYSKDAVSSVLSYNIVTKVFLQMSSLPFPMLDMATVRIGDDILIIGGTNQQNREMETFFKYNYKTMQCTQLPSMKYKRSECAAVISGHQVFVVGGDSSQGCHNSVECFDLLNQVWVELPQMSEAKTKLTAVCVPAHFF